MSTTNKAANVIPQFELGAYISSPFEVSLKMLIEQVNKGNNSGHS